MNENDPEEEMLSAVFSIGDLIWTKIGKHPFWPAMVTYDPHNACFLKFLEGKAKEKGRKQLPIYHVQYFGESALRGWTRPGKSFRFKGYKDYLTRTQGILPEKSAVLGYKSRKMWKDKYVIPQKATRKWQVAVEEAETALGISYPIERFYEYVFNYETGKRKTTVSNGMATPCTGSSDTYDESAPSSKRIRMSDDCNICGENNAVFPCTGVCSKFFHMDCLGIAQVQENFKCPECSSAMIPELASSYSCFACKKFNGCLRKCYKCSKSYHDECLSQYECANRAKNRCPLHSCLTCYRENPRNAMVCEGPMVQCVECPTAFHDKISCIAAGSVKIASSIIICPYHFLGNKRISRLATCNFNYCSECYSGGELVCCEACPRAFHENCLKTPVPNEDFFCEDCINRRILLYGMVIWGKIGHYRWWPAQIIHESHLPNNVLKTKHYRGEFAVRFFGTHNYTWTHSGRVFPYLEGHKIFKVTRSQIYPPKYKIGLLEAAVALKQYQKTRHSLMDLQPDVYKPLKWNRALPPAQINTNVSNILTCSCNPSDNNPCGPESQCLNRSMLMECHPEFCLAKELCQNQKFQKRHYVATRVFKTKNCGWGLKTCQDVKKDQFIIEYVGEIITHEEFRRRSGEMLKKGLTNYYFLYLDSKRMIDAGPMGNSSRFINHSCDPNCEMRKWSVNGDARIGIFAITDIFAGQELTFNYQSDKREFEQKCFCSSENCRGFIGRKTKLFLEEGEEGRFNKNPVELTLGTHKAFTSKTPSKIPASKKRVLKSKLAAGKERNKSALNSKKYSKLPSSSTSANSSKLPSSSTSASSSKLPSSSTSANSSELPSSSTSANSSPPASSSHVGSLVSEELRRRLSRWKPECCLCRGRIPGRLYLCDHDECLTAYHLSCLGLTSLPNGIWKCPKHS